MAAYAILNPDGTWRQTFTVYTLDELAAQLDALVAEADQLLPLPGGFDVLNPRIGLGSDPLSGPQPGHPLLDQGDA